MPPWGTLICARNKKMGLDGARVHLESSNLVYRHVFSQKSKWHGLFTNAAICRGGSFCDWNRKIGTGRARVPLESPNLVFGMLFQQKSKWPGLFCINIIYRGGQYSDWSKKMGTDRGRVRCANKHKWTCEAHVTVFPSGIPPLVSPNSSNKGASITYFWDSF